MLKDSTRCNVRQNPQRALTARERALYVAIVEHKKTHDGNSPSSRDLMEVCHVSSTSVLRFHLQRLEAAGLIRMDRGIARAIRVVGATWCLDRWPPPPMHVHGAITKGQVP